MGLDLNKLLDFSKFIHPKVCILQCFGMNKLLGQILAVGRAIRTKSLSLFVLFVAELCVNAHFLRADVCQQVEDVNYSHSQPRIRLFLARVPGGSVRRADLIAELIADLNAICAICRSYIGHIWAIHKLYISHVQPTVQATDGPYPVSRKWGQRPKAAAPHFLHIYYGHLWPVPTVGCTWLMYSLCMARIWPMYDLHMAHIAFRSAKDTDLQGTLASKSLVCCRK